VYDTHAPVDLADFAQQRIPDAAHFGHQLVDAAVHAQWRIVRRVRGRVATAVRLHLVADHALDCEHDVGCDVVERTQVVDPVAALVARRVVDDGVAGIRIIQNTTSSCS
jgi:hypothetical protein